MHTKKENAEHALLVEQAIARGLLRLCPPAGPSEGLLAWERREARRRSNNRADSLRKNNASTAALVAARERGQIVPGKPRRAARKGGR